MFTMNFTINVTEKDKKDEQHVNHKLESATCGPRWLLNLILLTDHFIEL